MQGRTVSTRRVVGLAVALWLAVSMSAVASDVTQVSPGKFKCPAKQQKPFCIKNTSGGSIIVTGLTVYKEAKKKGDKQTIMSDAAGQGGDDLKMSKNEKACWCVSFKPGSFSVSVFAGDKLAFGGTGGLGWMVAVDLLNGLAGFPALWSGNVAVELAEGVSLPGTDLVGEDLWVEGGESALLPGVTFRGEDGELFSGWLRYGGAVEAVTADDVIDLDEQ